MTVRATSVLGTIGNTPHIRLERLFPHAEVWIKSERTNPGGSMQDRVALALVEAAERQGALARGGTIVEPTGGDAGVGLALVTAVKGYRLILVMPESASPERRRLMLAYGAAVELTPAAQGIRGAIAHARQLADTIPGAWMPHQLDNPANIDAHARTTALEVLADFRNEPIDAIVAGVGTGSHATALAETLKMEWPGLEVFAVESESPALPGHVPVPANLHADMLDGVIRVGSGEAQDMARRAARREGLLVGISTGATLAAIARKLPDLEGARILGFAYDSGERYFSVPGFLPAAEPVLAAAAS